VSEYQYYEFLTIDRPLDARQQQELRALSTRARITATRFVNTYHWGDLDWREASLDGRPGVEFSWEGHDDCDHASGRGWAVQEDDGSLRGHIYFHLGDDSGFRAEPDDEARPKAKNSRGASRGRR